MKRNKLSIILFTLALLANLAAAMPHAAYAADDDFVPVEDIIGVPTTATAQPNGKDQRTPLELKGTVVPADATYKTITWSVKDAGATGATITDGLLDATKSGDVIVTASIAGARISAGFAHTMELKADGSLWAWGNNEYGQLGLGDEFKDDYSSTPLRVGTENNWASVVVGKWHTIALKTDGTLWAWGYADDGQLGLGEEYEYLVDDYDYKYVNTPVQVGVDVDWAAVSTGQAHTAAIKKDGSLWTWGDNEYCQLGFGGNCLLLSGDIIENRSEPGRVGTGNDWEAISAGDSHNVARKTNGSLWAWGWNPYGQLGVGSNDYQIPTPEQIFTAGGNNNDWAEVSASYGHTMALKKDGSLWAWGLAEWGQLGLGDGYNYLVTNDAQQYKYVNAPVRIGEGDDWTAAEAGGTHTMALKNDGSLWVWGWADYGQLGLGEDYEYLVTNDEYQYKYVDIPVQVGEGKDWMVISANISDHNVAMKKDGSLWAWGDNWTGQLGFDNDFNYSYIPVQIAFPDGQTAAYTRDFTIKTILFGDMNNDGVVDEMDVVALERYLARWPVSINESAADLNSDGLIDEMDIVVLERYLARWPGYETLPLNPQQ